MEVADWVRPELLLGGPVAGHLGQAADAMALQAAVQSRPGQVRNGGLKAIKAVIERQQRVPAEGHDDGLLLGCQHAGAHFLRSHLGVGCAGALTPLLNRGGTDPVAPGQRSYALLT